MSRILKHFVFPLNLTKTLIYSTEYRLLYQLSKVASLWVSPPGAKVSKELVNYFKSKVIELHREDAKNVSEGYYPLEVIRPKGPIQHIKTLPHLMIDSLKISRRRKVMKTKDLEAIDESAPDYLKRNYHFQTDGYFSEKSAQFYEHQVEILFSGTAAPMRRMLIKAIKDYKNFASRPLRILEIGAGVGSATLDFVRSFDFSSYVVSDISDPYLKIAAQRMEKPGVEFVKAAAESLPFEDSSFDLVFSVYLFHELPRKVRKEVLSEAHRVLAPGGVFAVCDSLQKNDDPKLDGILEDFPKDYHEPFYKDYTLWDMRKSLENQGFKDVLTSHKFLSKYWVTQK